MDAIVFEDRLIVGVDTIDQEHRELFDDAAALVEALAEGAPADRTGALLEAIEAHLVAHFDTEERWMRDTRFPGYVTHKYEHDRFVGEFLDWRTELGRVGGPTMESAFRRRLMGWLREHIGRADRQLATHLLNVPAQEV